jgi:hypothetical protein
MKESESRIVWRVRTADDSPQVGAFDALILAADSASQDRLRPSRLTGIDVPFERELPDIGLTLIVRANSHDAGLIAECDVLNADGTRRMFGRSHNSLAVFVCSRRGIIVTGLPAPPSPVAPAP